MHHKMSGSMLPLSPHINPANDRYCSQTWNGAQRWLGIRVHTYRLGDFKCKLIKEKKGGLCGHFGPVGITLSAAGGNINPTVGRLGGLRRETPNQSGAAAVLCG
ncbi:hypothetical protein ILYODFUR_019145 [Ilyodon furcidens]|uniref:Uncharacterized protein n=1 Tax=Ilyodon furcidens TaxID=33524 RepID=A0ABV0U7Y4_9TELE